jgi:hypothetical protein
VSTTDRRWSYEPDRREALLHIVGWFLFALLVLMAIVGRNNSTVFDLLNVPGFGWIISLAAMEVLARRRAGLRWGWSGWSGDTLRRAWQINAYTLQPWKVRHSWRLLTRVG